MWYVNSKPIYEDEINLLYNLRADLANNGIDLLKDINRSGNNIMITCPSHKDGKEYKPSCGILMDNFNKPNCVHCLACGYTDTLEGFVTKCFNETDKKFGIKWLEKYCGEDYTSRLLDSLDKKFKYKKESVKYIDKTILEQYNNKHDYMYKRGLTDEIIDKFKIGYDKGYIVGNRSFECITFPIMDENGNLIFIARRSINSKAFFLPSSTDKPIYGLYEALQDTKKTVYVCEGPFDALTCWTYGKPAIALLGTGSYKQYEILNKLPFNYIVALDGDEAGIKGRERFIKNVKNKLVRYVDLDYNKDINDISKEEFDNLKIKFGGL